MVSRVLEKMGETIRAREMIYTVVGQTVLLYGINSWLITEAMMEALEAFYHRISRRVMGKTDQHVGEGVWEAPCKKSP